MKTIGLLGGMSWESTRIYYDALNRGVAARRGGLHSADLLLASLDFAPLEALMAAGRWEELSTRLAGAASRLETAGAGCIALATNTMHKCADAVVAAVDVPFVHIVDVLAEALLRDGRHSPLLLGTRFTMEDDFFVGRLKGRGIHARVPQAPGRAEIHAVIFGELVRGVVADASRARFLEIIDRGHADGADSVILGCTEIGMLIAPGAAGLPVYDTTTLHCDALLDFALRPEEGGRP